MPWAWVLVAVDFLGDIIGGSEVGFPYARITIEVEADHTGAVDSPQTTTAKRGTLAGLSAAADAPTASDGTTAAAAAVAIANADSAAATAPQISQLFVNGFLLAPFRVRQVARSDPLQFAPI
jgi:hypothetical protein